MSKNLNEFDPIDQLTANKTSAKNSRSFVIAFLLAAIIATSFASWYLYEKNKDKPEGDVVVISADNEEIKIKPSDPGGMVVDNMDRVIYDTIDGYKDRENEEAKLLPSTEEPIDKSTLVEAVPVETTENIFIEQQVVQENTQTSGTDKAVKVEPEQEEFITPVVKAEVSKKLVELAKKSEKTVRIQLASFRSKVDAQKEWENLSRKHSKVLSKYEHYIVSKAIEGKGNFYRLQIGPFESETEAHNTCKKFKESGINCFTVK